MRRWSHSHALVFGGEERRPAQRRSGCMCSCVCACVRVSGSGLPTVDWLGVASLGVVEPIRPFLYLHPPAWTEPESARDRRRSFPPCRKEPRRWGWSRGMTALAARSEVKPVLLLSPCSARLTQYSNRSPMLWASCFQAARNSWLHTPHGWGVQGPWRGWRTAASSIR